eukprot:450643_1
MTTWENWMNAAIKLGFRKATIIHRTSYKTLASSSSTDIATLWTDYNKCVINENQELLDNWGENTCTKSTFCFYGKKFRIILRDTDPNKEAIKQQNNLLTFGYVRSENVKDVPTDITQLICSYICDIQYGEKRMKIIQSRKICKYIVGLYNWEIIIAYQFKTIWFIAYGLKQKRVGFGHDTVTDFYGVEDAWNQIHHLFQFLEQEGI